MMNRQAAWEQRIWEYLYDLLPPAEAEEVRRQISSDPDVARWYAEVCLQRDLVAEAARLDLPPISLAVPEGPATEDAEPASPIAPPAQRRTWGRTIHGLAALAATLLVGFLGYSCLRPEAVLRVAVIESARQSLVEQQVRLTLLGPPELPASAPGSLILQTRSTRGQPLAVPVTYAFYSHDDRVLQQGRAASSPQGSLTLQPPTELAADSVRVEVAVADRPEVPALTRTLRVAKAADFSSDTLPMQKAAGAGDRRPVDLSLRAADALARPPTPDEQPVMLNARGTVAAGEPLALEIHAQYPARTLSLEAVCRGIRVGRQEVTPDQFRGIEPDAGACAVQMELAPHASGVIRVTAYDTSRQPAQAVAERLVYRWPRQRLQIRVEQAPPQYLAGEPARLKLAVANEQGQPLAAELDVSLIAADPSPADEKDSPRMTASFLLSDVMPRDFDWQKHDFLVRPDDPHASAALDAMLHTQGSRVPPVASAGLLARASDRSAVNGQEVLRKNAAAEAKPLATMAAAAPVVLADNADQVTKAVERAMAGWLAQREADLRLRGQLVAGAAIVVLLILVVLGLWRWTRPISLWVPALTAATVSLVVGILWMGARVDPHGRVAWWPAVQPSGPIQVAFRDQEQEPASGELERTAHVQSEIAAPAAPMKEEAPQTELPERLAYKRSQDDGAAIDLEQLPPRPAETRQAAEKQRDQADPARRRLAQDELAEREAGDMDAAAPFSATAEPFRGADLAPGTPQGGGLGAAGRLEQPLAENANLSRADEAFRGGPGAKSAEDKSPARSAPPGAAGARAPAPRIADSRARPDRQDTNIEPPPPVASALMRSFGATSPAAAGAEAPAAPAAAPVPAQTPAPGTAPATPPVVAEPIAPAQTRPLMGGVAAAPLDAPVPAPEFQAAGPESQPKPELAKDAAAAEMKAPRPTKEPLADEAKTFPSIRAEKKQDALAERRAFEESGQQPASREVEGPRAQRTAKADQAAVAAPLRHQRLAADDAGRAELEFPVPPRPGAYLLLIQGRAAAAIGSTEIRLVAERSNDR